MTRSASGVGLASMANAAFTVTVRNSKRSATLATQVVVMSTVGSCVALMARAAFKTTLFLTLFATMIEIVARERRVTTEDVQGDTLTRQPQIRK